MLNINDIPEEKRIKYAELIEKNKKEISKRKVAVIAMYCNRYIWTKCCFHCLLPESTGIDYNNYKLILVNNGSEDNSSDFFNNMATYKPFIEQIRHLENKGKPWAFNHALEQITNDYDYVVSIDGDVEMPNNWLADMITCFESLERQGVSVGQLACDYVLMPGCRKTVNPNTLNQPNRCKILDNGIILDTTPDVAGGCILWRTKTIKAAGGYQIITSETTGKNHLYGMDDGLINLHLKKKSMLSCYLVNVKAKHWGDYDEAIFDTYVDWKRKNLNPVMQSKIKPHEIGEEFEWNPKWKYQDIMDARKPLTKCINENAFEIICKLYQQGCDKLK